MKKALFAVLLNAMTSPSSSVPSHTRTVVVVVSSMPFVLVLRGGMAVVIELTPAAKKEEKEGDGDSKEDEEEADDDDFRPVEARAAVVEAAVVVVDALLPHAKDEDCHAEGEEGEEQTHSEQPLVLVLDVQHQQHLVGRQPPRQADARAQPTGEHHGREGVPDEHFRVAHNAVEEA